MAAPNLPNPQLHRKSSLTVAPSSTIKEVESRVGEKEGQGGDEGIGKREDEIRKGEGQGSFEETKKVVEDKTVKQEKKVVIEEDDDDDEQIEEEGQEKEEEPEEEEKEDSEDSDDSEDGGVLLN